MTGEHVVWCTREELAGNAPLDLNTSPPAYRHRRTGPCPCGAEHEHAGTAPRSRALTLVARVGEPTEAPKSQHEIYAAALELLDLHEDVLVDLTRRGLTLEHILETGYRAIPHTLADRKRLLARLVDRFGEQDLRRVPGFTDKNDHLFFWHGAGYLVPYRGGDGKVTGLQCKLIGGKYLTARGSKVAHVHHLTGPHAPGCDLYVTEGGLKAEVAARLGWVAVFGVPGQSLTPEHVSVIASLQPGRVIVALDQEGNDQTAQARGRWVKVLSRAGLPTFVAVWEGADVGGPKGLDDLFLAGGRPRIRRCAFAPEGMTERRLPQPSAEPGAVAGGRTLEAARRLVRERIQAFLTFRGHTGPRALLVRAAPGTGKTQATADSLPRATAAVRLVVGTNVLAEEQAAAHGYHVVYGRSATNCQRFDVVSALGQADHDVTRLACGTIERPRCPFRAECAYFAQFTQPGPLIGATEQLFNPSFIGPASLVVVDDADLLRALVEERVVATATLHRAVEQLARRRREPVQRVLRLLAHACIDAPAEWLQGPAVWDHLAATARRQGQDLAALIGALPARATLPDPETDADGYVSADGVAAVPPASLLRVIEALQEELPAFQAGEDFNSRLRIRTSAIGVAQLRPHAVDHVGRPFLREDDLLVLDGTPIEPLVAHLTVGHHRLPDVIADVALPQSVHVIQHASQGNGHFALHDAAKLQAVLAEVASERQRFPVERPELEAVVGYRVLREPLRALGFAPSQVCHYGSLRGTNALAEVQRLHVVGRPFPPPAELTYLAQVIYHDEPAVSDQLVLASRAYGGQRYEIATTDFQDPRVAALLRACREDELLQTIHRARAAGVENQLSMEALLPLQESTARTETRHAVYLILHTGHVVPGLRVDELVLSVPRTDRNTERGLDAEQRIAAAIHSLELEHADVTVAAVARRAGASRQTVAEHFGKGAHTLQRESPNRCVQVSQTGDAPSGCDERVVDPRQLERGRRRTAS